MGIMSWYGSSLTGDIYLDYKDDQHVVSVQPAAPATQCEYEKQTSKGTLLTSAEDLLVEEG